MEPTQIARAQSRIETTLEAALNVGSGFLVSWVVWLVIVAPLYGFPISADVSLSITTIFTVTSFLRSYFWRRLFNWRSVCQHSRK